MAEQKQESKNKGGESIKGLLPVGTEAPDFTLNSTPAQSYSLRDVRGKAVVLVFYPADWSPVCGDQLAWNYLSPQGVNPGADGILNALESMTPEQRGQRPAARAKEGEQEKVDRGEMRA